VLSRYNWASGGTAAEVIINEIGANEPGSDTAGEFVELLNAGGTAANIGGWTLSDGSSVRHTFPAGTTLAAGKAIVVFGASSGIPAGHQRGRRFDGRTRPRQRRRHGHPQMRAMSRLTASLTRLR
jgi:hypothetical protein